MSVLIFRLNDVSEEEAQDVRELLNDHDLDFYETSPGRWGLSVAGLWLKNENQKVNARELIDEYQLSRSQHFASLQNEYRQETLIDRLKKSPVQFIAYTSLALFILFISLSPFVNLLVE